MMTVNSSFARLSVVAEFTKTDNVGFCTQTESTQNAITSGYDVIS